MCCIIIFLTANILQKWAELKVTLGRYFHDADEGVQITFWLPDSTKVVHSFDPDANPIVCFACIT